VYISPSTGCNVSGLGGRVNFWCITAPLKVASFLQANFLPVAKNLPLASVKLGILLLVIDDIEIYLI